MTVQTAFAPEPSPNTLIWGAILNSEVKSRTGEFNRLAVYTKCPRLLTR